MNGLGILLRARDILSERKHWTQGALFRFQPDGYESTLFYAPVGFCAVGALHHSRTELGASLGAYQVASDALRDACYRLFADNPTSVNDYRGYQATMQAYDAAIEAARR